VAELGPLLLARMLNLNEVQAGVLTAAFRIADDQGWLLLDLKDLRAMMQHVAENASQYTAEYGNISSASVGAVQRSLLQLEHEGADQLFGEPALNLVDMMQTDAAGRGFINILAADRLYNAPRVYASLLLWILSELFEQLPEVGDIEKPRLVFFFDEAHLLFSGAPKALMDKIEQVVRLIRSKGVGVYFISQNPLDIPEVVLGQLGNRVPHALRACTPRDQKAVKAAAETFRSNPGVDVASVITELGVGEALVSFLDDKGRPLPVERAFVCPPGSRIGIVTDQEWQQTMRSSLVSGFYEKQVDRESAYEILRARAEKAVAKSEIEATANAGAAAGRSAGRQPDTLLETVAKTAARTVGSELGRRLVRGILGSLLGGRK
jgi:DNA helicase HerA-like ATPase